MKVLKPIEKFNNGNNICLLYEDGTSVVKGDQNLEFPLNIDCRISSKCDIGCPMCYENNTPQGKFCDLLSQTWIKSLHKGTEVALNFNSPIEEGQILNLLNEFRVQGVYPNATVNYKTFLESWEFLYELQQEGLLFGIGISLPEIHKLNERELFEIKENIRGFKNIVFHTIVGLFSSDDLDIIKKGFLGDPENIKLLFLGYKHLGRGIDLYESMPFCIKADTEWLKDKLKDIFNLVGTVSFDCLAMGQLDVKSHVNPEDYDKFYLGEDGTRSLYIDMVNNKFAKSSTEITKFDINGKTVSEMFKQIKNL